MKKHSIWREIKDTIQEAVHNIELMSLLISIILGGAGAILFFLNSSNKLNLLSVSLTELIGATIFLWAILAFFLYKFMLIHSQIIKFLRQKSLWQFVGWFILISIPFLLIEVQRTTQNYIEILIFVIISILMWGLVGLIFAVFVNGFIPLHLVMRQIKLIIVISAIIFIVLDMVVLSVIATENKLSFLTVILNWTNWKPFLTYFAQVYWFLFIFMIFIWSIIDKSIHILTELKAWSFNAKSKLTIIEQFLVNKLKIHRLFLWIFGLLFLYFVIIKLTFILFDYSILYEDGIWRQLFLPSTFHRVVAFILFIIFLFIGAVLFICLILVTEMYITSPLELERIRFLNKIQKMLLIFFLLFILWWFSWTSVALNLEIFNQNAFAYTDGRTGKPNIWDLLFYIFALMTSAGYGELKALSSGAHILVMAVTSTGLGLLVIFVGAALSFESKSSKLRLLKLSRNRRLDSIFSRRKIRAKSTKVKLK